MIDTAAFVVMQNITNISFPTGNLTERFLHVSCKMHIIYSVYHIHYFYKHRQ
jgi:hypothetical protein